MGFNCVMKRFSLDPLFCGIISLQIAAAVLVFSPIGTDSIPLNSVSNSWNRASLEVGHPFPELAAYNSRGARQSLNTQGEERTFIFRSTCSCEDTAISNWTNSALVQKQLFTVLIPLSREATAKTSGRVQWKKDVLQVRFDTLQRLGLIKDGRESIKRLPLAVRVDKDGVVLGVQTL